MTHISIKGRTFFRAHASQGLTKTGYYPDIFATVLEAPSIRHFVYMATHKTLFDIFQPSTAKPNQTSSTRQKRKSDEDPQDILGPKKCVFSSKWLEEFAWFKCTHCMCQPKNTWNAKHVWMHWTFCQTIPSFRARCKEFAWLVCHTVCVKRKTHEMQNMFGCIWTFGQTIPSFRAWCD